MAIEKRGKEILKRIGRDIKGAAAVAAAFLICYLIIHWFFDSFCPFLILTGLPCPGCGLTRAGLYLLRGRIDRAAYSNPSIFLILAFGLYCAYFRYIKGTPVRGVRVAIGILVTGMLGIYVVRMYLHFPGQAPYVYQSDNLLAVWMPGYKEWMGQIMGEIGAWRRHWASV